MPEYREEEGKAGTEGKEVSRVEKKEKKNCGCGCVLPGKTAKENPRKKTVRTSEKK